MKLFSFIFLLLFSSFLLGQVPSFEWGQGFGGNGQDMIYESAIDNNGFVYNVGFFSGTADFDPSLLSSFNLTSTGSNIDAFVQKLDPNGNFIWAISFGGVGADHCSSISIDDNNNLYLTGYFSDTVDFNPGVDSSIQVSNGDYDCYVLKLDEFGGFDWVRTFGSSESDEGVKIFVYQSNVYTVGDFSEVMDLNPSAAGVNNVPFEGGKDIFALKLNSNGDYLWGETIGGNLDDSPRAVIANSTGVYICGHFMDLVDFDPSPNGNVNISTAGSGDQDMFVLRLTSSGSYSWVNTHGNSNNDGAVDMDFDNTGNVLITGYFTGTVDFDSNPVFSTILSSNSPNFQDAFIQKISSSGSFIWVRNVGGYYNDMGLGVDVDAIGNVNYCGFFTGNNVDFDPSANSTDLFSTVGNNEDVFFSKLTSNGNYISTKSFGGNGVDISGNIISDVNGNVYLSGFFNGLVDFNPPNGAYFQALGPNNAFSIKYKECYITSDSISITQCGSYIAPDGQTYTSSGVYTAIIPNVQGCDSIITIDLIININTLSLITINTCSNSYTAPDGQVYTSSGLYNATIPNSFGCDSNIFITLNFNTTYDTITASSCNNYSAPNGLIYNSSGTYTAIIPNSLGCDSVITIYLTITNSNNSTVLESSCGPYTAPDGQVYTTSGTYTAILPGPNGCDSVITIVLTVNSIPLVNSTSNQQLCPGFLSNSIPFTGNNSNTTYIWSNNNTSIGLASSGTGDINSFLTLNNSAINQQATLIVTPSLFNCLGEPDTFLIMVFSSPNVDQISDIDLCNQDSIGDIIFTGGESNCTYSWNNNNPSIGLGIDGVGDIPSFLATNTGLSSSSSVITVVGNQNGCTGPPMTFNMTINVVDVSVTTLNPTLIANAVGAQYQWIDCDENLPISGQTNSSFTSVQSGNYAVIVTQNGCIDTSWCYSLNLVLSKEELMAENFRLYPNPTNGKLQIENPYLAEDVLINIRSLNGQLLYSNYHLFDSSLNLFLDFIPGVYILELISANQRFNYRVVKN
ncbi:MAG: T9SS type A sorting domain-containing protein [Crocinitomicaceae bacterium]|nr:T9SS type A sorting domain-containing protein [Crocinitomicaceae bacterium]